MHVSGEAGYLYSQWRTQRERLAAALVIVQNSCPQTHITEDRTKTDMIETYSCAHARKHGTTEVRSTQTNEPLIPHPDCCIVLLLQL